MTAVMARPMTGSAIGRPSATTAALARTPRLTKPSTRAWLPSATSAGLFSRRPARSRTWAAISLPMKKDLVAGSGIAFDDRGPATLKGIEGEWRLFAVDAAADHPAVPSLMQTA